MPPGFPQYPGMNQQSEGLQNLPQRTPVYRQGLIRQGPAGDSLQKPRMTNPAVWSNSVPDAGPSPVTNSRFSHGSYGTPAPNPPGPQTAAPAPQYFSRPPVMGAGHRDQSVVSPDPLVEYRNTRQQRKNEFNQTLQAIGHSYGGRSFQ